MKMTFLIDGDNNLTKGLQGIDMLTADDKVMIFHKKGASLTRVKKLTDTSKANVEFYPSAKEGKNSIDFQIVAELGVLIGKKQIDYAYIISHDQGYLASIESLKKRYANEFKEIDLRETIESCLHLPFIRRASTKQELSNALVKEYGNIHGKILYNHLKTIFSRQEEPKAQNGSKGNSRQKTEQPTK